MGADPIRVHERLDHRMLLCADKPIMERRRDVRVRLNQAVRVTCLSANCHMQGRAADLSLRGIRILIPARLAVGDPVRIEIEDALLLGEVCYCQPYDRGFMIGVQIDQALNGLSELAHLHQTLLQDGVGRLRNPSALSYSISEQTESCHLRERWTTRS